MKQEFNIRGYVIQVDIPRSLEEINRRIDHLTISLTRLHQELKKMRPKSSAEKQKQRLVDETMIEKMILKRWRRNALVILEDMLAKSDIVNSKELRTEAGLIKYLYQEFRRLEREGTIVVKKGSRLAVILAAGQYWLRQHYSTAIPYGEMVLDLPKAEKDYQRQEKANQQARDRAETEAALRLLSQLTKGEPGKSPGKS